MLRRLLTTIELMRPHNMLAASLCVYSGYFVANGRDFGLIALPLLFTALVTGVGNVINDHFDIEIDRINKPRRPLPSGRIAPRQALTLYAIVTGGVTVASLALLEPATAAVLIAWEVLLFAYASRAKRMLVFGNILVAATTSSAFWLGALVAGAPVESAVPFAIAFMFVLSREVVKGAEDVDGDTRAGVHTIAAVFGAPAARMVAVVLMVLLSALIPIPGITGYYSKAYFWTMEGLVVPGLIVSMLLMTRDPSRRTFNRVSWILKAGMFFGIFAIALGHL